MMLLESWTVHLLGERKSAQAGGQVLQRCCCSWRGARRRATRGREHDRDLSGSLPERQTLAGWRDGTMALRWRAAGMVEAGMRFRRSMATYTFPRSEPLSNGMSRSKMSEPTTTITPRIPPDDHRTAVENPRRSGHFRRPWLTHSARTTTGKRWRTRASISPLLRFPITGPAQHVAVLRAAARRVAWRTSRKMLPGASD